MSLKSFTYTKKSPKLDHLNSICQPHLLLYTESYETGEGLTELSFDRLMSTIQTAAAAAGIRIGSDGPLNTPMVPGKCYGDMRYRAHTKRNIGQRSRAPRGVYFTS